MTVLCQRLYFLVSEHLTLQIYQQLFNLEEALERFLFKRLGYKVKVERVEYDQKEEIITFSMYASGDNINYCMYVLDGHLDLEEGIRKEIYAK